MSAENQPNNLQKRQRCPKGTKMSKSIKMVGAMRSGDKADRRAYMRAMATVEHEAAHKLKMATRATRTTATPATAGRVTTGESSVAPSEE